MAARVVTAKPVSGSDLSNILQRRPREFGNGFWKFNVRSNPRRA